MRLGSAPAKSAPPEPVALPWPTNVPSLEVADGLLSGAVEPPPELEAATQAFIKTLSKIERTIGWGGELPFDATSLRKCLQVRMRLSLALATKPQSGAAVDGPAIEKLFAEVDAALAELSANAEGRTPEHQQAVESSRAALARDAVEASEAIQGPMAGAGNAAQVAQRVAKKAKTGRITFEMPAAQAPTRAGKTVVMFVFFGLAVVAAGAYHLPQFLQDKDTSLPTIAGAPPNSFGTVQQGTGIKLIHSLDGKPLDPKVLEKLRADAEARGDVVIESVPGQFAIIPAAMKAQPAPEAAR